MFDIEKGNFKLIDIKTAFLSLGYDIKEANDIVWDVNLTKNSCIRVKENGVASVMDLKVKNFRKRKSGRLNA